MNEWTDFKCFIGYTFSNRVVSGKGTKIQFSTGKVLGGGCYFSFFKNNFAHCVLIISKKLMPNKFGILILNLITLHKFSCLYTTAFGVQM